MPGTKRSHAIKKIWIQTFLIGCIASGLLGYYSVCHYRPSPLSDSDLKQCKNADQSSVHSRLDELYLINLDRSSDRLKQMHSELAKHSLNFLHFKAIDGYQFEGLYDRYLEQGSEEAQTIDAQKNYMYRYDPLINKYGLSMGELGNYFSHYEVLSDIAERQLQRALVLEDDAVLDEDFKQKVSALLSHAPNGWDIIYLNCFAELDIGCRLEKLSTTLNGRFIKLNKKCTAGNGAYIVGMQGARKLLSNANPASDRTDERIAKQFFTQNFRDFKAYCSYPELVTVGKNGSIIDDMGRHSERP